MSLLRLALLSEKAGNAGWYGVDLDSTLAMWEDGQGIDSIGAPILKMVEFVQQLLREGKEVRVMTARVGGDDTEQIVVQSKMIALWTEEHIGQALPATCQKDQHMIRLYDDRARQVVANEGTIIEA